MPSSPDPASTWASFTHDPRAKANAGLRAGDADREVVLRVLGEAYADGRLTREEHDERATRLAAARTFGELRPLLDDLVPTTPAPVRASAALATAGPDDLRRMAVREWESHRRSAILAFIGPTLICWAVWVATSFGGGVFSPDFPWPLIVMAVTGFHLVRTLVTRQELIATELERLQRRQAKALRGRRRP
ncbi:DUF1707 domain-containing protein [Nocardioides marmotae]|uniref:DUF1707 domain-containing protein n=1 Tax=Nocardioides marmotae TaxID=2663857 RepID=A0A6I3IWP0_9ACTN|nr:DUF1707 domain-containing protein [Nocardioides marmotae]MCR6031154.1 DUF1707 domain-containing protein [Gordonia jinghuaiqii]MTB82991.1 DUF1707 domain-containing protein [Nocardioides marmotae]MTB94793.1 DUF1707 domain-containing protein [Nocardioides marmotae]QKE01214.1 DUF1707 domain-containing protein [Nocardioides marmotae]